MLATRHRLRRRLILLLDLIVLLFASMAALILAEGTSIGFSPAAILAAIMFTIITLVVFTSTRVYRAIIRHLNVQTVVLMVLILLSISGLWSTMLSLSVMPGTNAIKLFVLQWFLTSCGLVGYRFVLLLALHENGPSEQADDNRIGIYGTTEMARQLIASMRRSKDHAPAFLLTDDVSKADGMIDNVRVYHVDEIDWPIRRFSPSAIVFCCGEQEFRLHRQLVERIVRKNIPVRLYTGFVKIGSHADLTINSRSVDIADLIGRQEIAIDREMIAGVAKGKRILVTGGGGSIGSRLCEHLAALGPELLAVLDFDEKSMVQTRRKIEDSSIRTQWHLADIRDEAVIERLFGQHQFDIVFHTAAYKHVDLCEEVPLAATSNNLMGTNTLITAALKHKVPRFVFISTDKAVDPISLMGATKRWGEELVRLASASDPTLRYCSVRFGNVIESSGSVVPLIKRQILEGGPVTITDRRMRRYFMSIDEAIGLILQSASLARDGETFILKMGKPIHIIEIAEKLIMLAGHTIRSDEFPDGEIEIVETGIRPGERLEEALCESDQTVHSSSHPSIQLLRTAPPSRQVVAKTLQQLDTAVREGDDTAIRSAVMRGLEAIDKSRGKRRTPVDKQEHAPLKKPQIATLWADESSTDV